MIVPHGIQMSYGKFTKKKAVFTNDPLIWKQFTDERNKVNNCVRKPKADNFQTDWVQVNLVNIKHDGQ